MNAHQAALSSSFSSLRVAADELRTPVTNINRSLFAYLANPAAERAQYADNVDKRMTVLRFDDSTSGKPLGVISWFAVHGYAVPCVVFAVLVAATLAPQCAVARTVMVLTDPAVTYVRISLYACVTAHRSTSLNNTNTLVASDNKGIASQLFEAAVNGNGTLPGQGPFVAAFVQTNEGDVTPNTGTMTPHSVAE